MSDSNELLASRLDSLHRDVGEIKTSVDKLSDAVVKLALVEERVATSQATLQRAFAAIEKNATNIEKLVDRVTTMQAAQERMLLVIERQTTAQESLAHRLERLERAEPKASAMANRVENALWALGAVVAVVVLRKVGLM